MTAEEKAKQLVDKFSRCRDISNTYYVIPIPDDSKQCALIAVDEILNYQNQLLKNYKFKIENSFYEQVKQEIEKL